MAVDMDMDMDMNMVRTSRRPTRTWTWPWKWAWTWTWCVREGDPRGRRPGAIAVLDHLHAAGAHAAHGHARVGRPQLDANHGATVSRLFLAASRVAARLGFLSARGCGRRRSLGTLFAVADVDSRGRGGRLDGGIRALQPLQQRLRGRVWPVWGHEDDSPPPHPTEQEVATHIWASGAVAAWRREGAERARMQGPLAYSVRRGQRRTSFVGSLLRPCAYALAASFALPAKKSAAPRRE